MARNKLVWIVGMILLVLCGCDAPFDTEVDSQEATRPENLSPEEQKEKATPFYEFGNFYYDQRRYKDAERKYTEAIAIYRDDADALYNRGLARANMDNQSAAVDDFSRVTELTPKHAYNWANLAMSLMFLKRFDQAVKAANRAVEIQANDAALRSILASIYLETGQYDLAKASYDEAIRIDGEYSLAFEGRAEAYAKTNDFEQALKDYTEAIRLDPTRAAIYRSRAEVYEKLGEKEKAKEDRAMFDKLVEDEKSGRLVRPGNQRKVLPPSDP